MDSTGPLIIEFEGICPVDSSMSSSPVSSTLGTSKLMLWSALPEDTRALGESRLDLLYGRFRDRAATWW